MSNQNFIEQLAEKLRAIGSLKAVGDTWVSFDSSVPPGGVPFCGQEVTRALYADLWAWAQQQGKVKTETEWQAHATANGGNCPYYSDGDGSTTFRMPCVIGYFKGANTASEGGCYLAQALPNFKGSITNVQSANAVASGALQIRSHDTSAWQSNITSLIDITVNPSADNTIYKEGANVTPETYKVLVGVYAVGVIQNINNTDVQQLQIGLATLEANVVKSVNGVTPTAGNIQINEINNRWGKPNETMISADSGVTFPYTATENGVFYARTDTGTGGGVLINDVRVGNLDQFSSISVPFKKGDKISLTGGTNNRYICLNKSDD